MKDILEILENGRIDWSDEHQTTTTIVTKNERLAIAEIKKLRARIAELEEAIEPFRRVKAITSIYEYVPVEALRDEEEFNFKMTGAEMKRIRAALSGERSDE